MVDSQLKICINGSFLLHGILGFLFSFGHMQHGCFITRMVFPDSPESLLSTDPQEKPLIQSRSNYHVLLVYQSFCLSCIRNPRPWLGGRMAKKLVPLRLRLSNEVSGARGRTSEMFRQPPRFRYCKDKRPDKGLRSVILSLFCS